MIYHLWKRVLKMNEKLMRLDTLSNIGIIGCGRLGSCLSIALDERGYQVVAVSTRRREHGEWLKSQLPRATVHCEPQEVANTANIIFITTSDSAITQIDQSTVWKSNQAVVHCSGATPVTDLEQAKKLGAMVGGFHPLQTFPTSNPINPFDNVTFGMEADEPVLNMWLKNVAHHLGGKVLEIKSSQRSAYHAAAVMACGLIAGLAGLAGEMLGEIKISRADALIALSPMMESTIRWVKEKGLPEAVTGPFVRGDLLTVEKHISATFSKSSEIGMAYSAIALATMAIAKEQGKLTEQLEEDIRSKLVNSLIRGNNLINKS